ncbi:MAG: peptidylprolyl isomerase [Colwellia sp.]
MTYIIKNKILLCLSILVTSLLASVATKATEWRKLDLDKTVLLTLPHGKVVIELAPQFSPNHVAQFSKLVQQGFYDGEKFYRVIDGFVAQGGPKDEGKKDKSVPTLAIEESWKTPKDWNFAKVQHKGLFAYETGFKDGFAIARDKPSENTETWLTHCPGVLAMGRGNEPDTATSHFYFVIGQAPRYLDRIMTVFGRVVYGMNHIQAIQRTSVLEGEKKINPENFTSMISMKLMRDVPEKERLLIEVEDTNTKDFTEKLHKRLIRENAFFYKKPPQVLDVCQVPVISRMAK